MSKNDAVKAAWKLSKTIRYMREAKARNCLSKAAAKYIKTLEGELIAYAHITIGYSILGD